MQKVSLFAEHISWERLSHGVTEAIWTGHKEERKVEGMLFKRRYGGAVIPSALPNQTTPGCDLTDDMRDSVVAIAEHLGTDLSSIDKPYTIAFGVDEFLFTRGALASRLRIGRCPAIISVGLFADRGQDVDMHVASLILTPGNMIELPEDHVDQLILATDAIYNHSASNIIELALRYEM